jgi:outer membrane protein
MNRLKILGFALGSAALAGAVGAQQAPPPPAAAPENVQISVSVSARAGKRRAEPIPAASEEGVRLSLKDAISLALANNVDLDIAVAGVESGGAGILQSKGIFDPLLSLNGQANDQQTPQVSRVFGSKTRTDDLNLAVAQEIPWGGLVTLGWNNEKQTTNSSFVTVNPAYTSTDSLELRQPLLRNFGIGTTERFIRIARNSRDANDEGFLQTLQSTISAVEQAYWDLVYARENLVVKQEGKGLAEELYRITKIKIDVGSQAPIDIVQTESGVAQRELDIITARAAVGDAEDRLKRLLNFAAVGRWNDHVIPTDEVRVEPVVVDLEAGVAQALKNRPEIHAALFTAATARVQFDYAKNQTLPQLDLLARYGYAGLGGDSIDPGPDGVFGTADDIHLSGGYGDAFDQMAHRDFHNWTVGLNFSIPIFNRAARGTKAAARWNLESSLATLEQLRQNFTVLVRGAERAIATARESIDAAGKARELAEKNLDAEKKKYDNGLVTSFEVLQVQNDLSAARTAELQALALYRKAVVAYHQAVGDLLAWKDIKVEGLSGDEPPAAESLRAEK